MAGHRHLQCERRVGCSSIIEVARIAIWRVSRNRVYIDMRISGNKRRECNGSLEATNRTTVDMSSLVYGGHTLGLPLFGL